MDLLVTEGTFLQQDNSVFRVNAFDQDKGINDAIIYSIEGCIHHLQAIMATADCTYALSLMLFSSMLFGRFNRRGHV